MSDIIKLGNIENKIIEIRDQQVILDFDVAELYGVVTKRVNEAIKIILRNFPKDIFLNLQNRSGERSELHTIIQTTLTLTITAMWSKI